MLSFSVLIVFCALSATCLGLPIADDRRSAISTDTNKEHEIVKRSAELKTISLKSFISDLETSLFRTAFGVSGIVYNKDAVIPEIRAKRENEKLQRQLEQRRLQEASTVSPIPSTSTVSTTPEVDVLLLTTEKVPPRAGVPAHIIIDRVSVQPHEGPGIAFIPAFEIKRLEQLKAGAAAVKVTPIATIAPTKQASSETKETASTTNVVGGGGGGGVVEVSTAKTTTTTSTASTVTAAATAVEKSDVSTTVAAVHADSVSKTAATSADTSSTSSSTTSTTTTTTTTTTPKPTKDELKEAEDDLHDKIAEIEAEPVIFSARI